MCWYCVSGRVTLCTLPTTILVPRQLSSLLALIVVLTNVSRKNSPVLPLSIQIVCRIVIDNVDTEDVGVNVNILENFMCSVGPCSLLLPLPISEEKDSVVRFLRQRSSFQNIKQDTLTAD